jgi:hypothetical protein
VQVAGCSWHGCGALHRPLLPLDLPAPPPPPLARYYVQDQATLALYALGKLTGCVVDIGHTRTDVATVTDGQVGAVHAVL